MCIYIYIYTLLSLSIYIYVYVYIYIYIYTYVLFLRMPLVPVVDEHPAEALRLHRESEQVMDLRISMHLSLYNLPP